MNADTLSCRFVTAEQPHPEATMYGYDCYKLLQNPNNDGIVVICAGLNNKNSLLMYDHDFNYEDGFILSPAFRESFVYSYSDHWLSDNRLLLMGDMKPYGEYTKWTIGMAEVGLDGTFDRWDRVYHKHDTAIQSSSDRCMAYANDTTIYGGSWFYTVLGGESHGSVCLYDTDMELLGRKEFIEPEYGDKASCRFVLPTVDGGCLVGLLTYFVNNGHRSSKLIKMNREDFNPIPCSVKELPKEAIKAMAYPNPAKDELNIDISGLPKHDENRIQIVDALGRICMDRIIRGEGNVLTVGVSSLKPGIYFYCVYSADRELLKGKFVKE
ncbi:MAG: T9SS type A sorting domain-containing protein [Bacteroidales bacterium]|nr:T9SS type A sorting domain-containing protein [Bacteroidales bacterium]